MKNQHLPLMTKEEIVDLVCYLNRETVMLEIGGGNSTVFLSRIVKKLVTLEHDKGWGNTIKGFEGLQDKNWELHIVEPNWPQSHCFAPAEIGQFDNYVNFLESLDEDFFDVILVDGRDRVRSAKATINKLKVGGVMLIHDFWNRTKYHSILEDESLELIEDENSHGKEASNTLVALKRIK